VLTHPEVVDHPADPLGLGGDFLREVLVETRFDGEALGKRRPVVLFTCETTDTRLGKKRSPPKYQFQHQKNVFLLFIFYIVEGENLQKLLKPVYDHEYLYSYIYCFII